MHGDTRPPALTPDSDGGTTRPVYRTTPAPHPATYVARACICLRHAPRPGLATRLAPALRAAPRGVSLSSPVPAHISVCLSLPPLPSGALAAPPPGSQGRDSCRRAAGPRTTCPYIQKKKIGPIIGAPPACLGHVSRAAWWLDLHVRRAWHCQGGGSCRYAYGRPSELRGGTREIGMLRQRRANLLDACMRSVQVQVGARDSDETHA